MRECASYREDVGMDDATAILIGALIGGQLDRGYSNTAGILIGGGAGALLGREIDRGSLSCR